MIRRLAILATLPAAALMAAASATTHAAVISEYFNDYGTTNVAVTPSAASPWTGNLNGGTGWTSQWQRSDFGAVGDYPDYIAGTNLTNSTTGYSNTGNDSGSDDGSAGVLVSSRLDRNAYRETGALTGTVWISFLWRVSSQFNSQEVLFTLDAAGGSGGNNRIQLRSGSNASNPGIRMWYNNSTATPTATVPFATENPATNTTHLAVLRVTLDYSGSFDRVELWSSPSNVASIAALGSPDLSADGADVFGTSLDRVGFNLSDTTLANVRMDAIRISNEPAGFAFITTGVIPEPASLALLALGGLLMFPRRRNA